MLEASQLRQQILDTQLEQNGVTFTFEEAWQTLQKIITVLPACVHGQFLITSFADLEKNILEAMMNAETRVENLTFEDALQLRHQVMQAVSNLIFDVAYSNLSVPEQQYLLLREQYGAAMMVVQLFDDAIDVFEDIELGISNTFLAAAAENNELQALRQRVDAGKNMPIPQRLACIAEIAPKTYLLVYNKQHQMLTSIENVVPSQVVLPKKNHLFQYQF